MLLSLSGLSGRQIRGSTSLAPITPDSGCDGSRRDAPQPGEYLVSHA